MEEPALRPVGSRNLKKSVGEEENFLILASLLHNVHQLAAYRSYIVSCIHIVQSKWENSRPGKTFLQL